MRRVVITGIGLVTPLGNDTESTWSALLAGKSGAGPITQFDTTQYATKFGCEVKNWDPSKWFDKRELKHVDRFLQFGVAASMMAMEDAGLGTKVPEGQEERWGCYIGSGLGGSELLEAGSSTPLAPGTMAGVPTGRDLFLASTGWAALPGLVFAANSLSDGGFPFELMTA